MEMVRNDRYIMRLALLLFALLLCRAVSNAKVSDRYDSQHPVVLNCDWELPPYEFLDDNGQPAGYTIDILTAIFKKLEIPYRFVMKENPLVNDSVRHERGRLFLVPNASVRDKDCHLSSNVLYYYRNKIASRNDAPVINTLDDIDSTSVIILRLDGQISPYLLAILLSKGTLEYHAPMEALSGVASSKYDYFVWGEEPLKWKIKELNLENLRINDISFPATEIRIGGYDEELVDAIDDQYARLEQNGDIDLLRDKWFHPERHHDNAPPIILYVAIAAGLLLLVMSLLNRLVARNVRRMTLKNSEQTRLMNMVLDMGGYMVTEYNTRRDRFKNIRGNLIDERLNMDEVVKTLHEDDVQSFQKKADELLTDKTDSPVQIFRRNDGTAAEPHWQYLIGDGIKERNEKNQTAFLLVAKDITKKMDEQHESSELAIKFQKAFDNSLIAISFYDANGRLLDMNMRMREIVGANDENLQFFNETSLFEAPLFRDILYKGMREVVHACQHMYYPDIHLDKYLEYRVRPAFTAEGEIRFYVVTVRDITAERNLYREQLVTERQLKMTTEEVHKFESQMNYLLSNSNMFIWRSNFRTRTIDIYRSLHRIDATISFDDYMESTSPEEKEEALAMLKNPLFVSQPVNCVRHLDRLPFNGHEGWLAVSGTPYADKSGKTIGHFGVIRDITSLMRSQEDLRHETERAEQSGQLKAAFLANMTHEIRTPLNAIIGFSDLLHMASTAEERKEFNNIIMHNCDMLLRLVDDIIETSMMEVKPQDITPADTDFATFFDEVCLTMEQRVRETGVLFVRDNPYTSLDTCIDKERIEQVITNFVTNAVKYTKEGHIRVGYRVTPDDAASLDIPETPEIPATPGLLIYCEDTGTGIPKDKQASVFDRFVKLNDYVQGTGLGLSICKSIADRCGGRIGVFSEGDGKGTTFWLWTPRFLTLSNLTAEK